MIASMTELEYLKIAPHSPIRQLLISLIRRYGTSDAKANEASNGDGNDQCDCTLPDLFQ